VTEEAKKLEDTLVERLCQRNGWEFGSEDGELAVEQVKWFLSQPETCQPAPKPDYLPTVDEMQEWIREFFGHLNPNYRDYLLMGVESLYVKLGGRKFLEVRYGKHVGGTE